MGFFFLKNFFLEFIILGFGGVSGLFFPLSLFFNLFLDYFLFYFFTFPFFFPPHLCLFLFLLRVPPCGNLDFLPDRILSLGVIQIIFIYLKSVFYVALEEGPNYPVSPDRNPSETVCLDVRPKKKALNKKESITIPCPKPLATIHSSDSTFCTLPDPFQSKIAFGPSAGSLLSSLSLPPRIANGSAVTYRISIATRITFPLDPSFVSFVWSRQDRIKASRECPFQLHGPQLLQRNPPTSSLYGS